VKRFLQMVVGIAISGVALWLTLRGKDLGAIWTEMRRADYRYLVPYVLLLLAIHLCRTVRWGILLEPVAKVPFRRLNAVAAVGFMALLVLPFRIGEFARPYLIAERPKLRVSSALSSVVVERVVDGIFMGLLLVVALLGVPENAPGMHFLRAGGLVVLAAFGGLLAFLVLAYRNRDLAVRLTARALGPFSPRLAERLSGMMDAFIHGLRLVPSRRKLVAFFALTGIYWAINAFGIELMGLAFGFRLGFVQSCTVLAVLVIGVMIPAGPGNVGTFQGALMLGLALFVPADAVHTRGVAYANVIWIAQLVQQVALGVLFLFSEHIQIARIFKAPAEVSEELEEEEEGYRGEAKR
jgi:uncharacterized protein (TIRG00374 family)